MVSPFPSCLVNRECSWKQTQIEKKTTKVGNKFSKWLKISTGVPLRSFLGPLLFRIFLMISLSLFIESTILCNYADEILCITLCKSYNDMYFSDKSANILSTRLRLDFAIILEWLYEKYMAFNASFNVIS